MVPPGGMSGSGGGGIRGNRPPMRGGSGRPRPASGTPSYSFAGTQEKREHAKKRVLFVCIGNSVRSQMAEAFARTYGSDVLEASSAGISPAANIAPLTHRILREKNINTQQQFPKGLDTTRETYDLVVNLSGQKLSVTSGTLIEWKVPDPMGEAESVYRDAARVIEDLVMRLILELRSA